MLKSLPENGVYRLYFRFTVFVLCNSSVVYPGVVATVNVEHFLVHKRS